MSVQTNIDALKGMEQDSKAASAALLAVNRAAAVTAERRKFLADLLPGGTNPDETVEEALDRVFPKATKRTASAASLSPSSSRPPVGVAPSRPSIFQRLRELMSSMLSRSGSSR